jgi:hypothetical protein
MGASRNYAKALIRGIDLLDDFFQTTDGASRRGHTFETRSQTRELFGGSLREIAWIRN